MDIDYNGENSYMHFDSNIDKNIDNNSGLNSIDAHKIDRAF